MTPDERRPAAGEDEWHEHDQDGEHLTGPGGDHRTGVLPSRHTPDGGTQDVSAVEWQRGQQVENTDEQVGARELEQQELGDWLVHRPGRDIRQSGGRQRNQRSGDRHHEITPGSRRVPFDLGVATQEVQGDAADRQAQRASGERMTDLVNQDRQVEEHRERQARWHTPPIRIRVAVA